MLVLAAVVYLLAEAISAIAWRNPTYSYSFNYISDLGVPERSSLGGRVINSPLHVVMNSGFIAEGVLFVIAAVLLWRLLSRRTGVAYLVLSVVHGIGIILVGLFHGSAQAQADGTGVFHGLGAMLAIGAGNAAAIVVGLALIRRASRSEASKTGVRGLGWALVALGVAGFASMIILFAITPTAVDGVFERGAVYTILAAELVVGIALIGSSRTAGSVDDTEMLMNAAGQQ